ncbi:DgyrCDS1303 [Dimorphilus gyrociliatus]|uniref:DgyrCDS1303 n=1 Tax=Dimorphilus gyrociliatus TaxID=2664684 RepID=A0A7I8V6V4_9ANNE|nr:DgyrCDS1303 [Dimorphilus gyrociliatus]
MDEAQASPSSVSKEFQEQKTLTEEWLRQATKSRASKESIVKLAEEVLREVPITKSAVFNYFSEVFDEAVNVYFQSTLHGPVLAEDRKDLDKTKQDLFNAVEVIRNLFGDLIDQSQTNVRGWAPIVATWSMDMLGHISKTFFDKINLVQTATNLNVITQAWINCLPSKLLVEITAKSFGYMSQMSSIDCEPRLWEKAKQYTPYFDWVVAYVGSCFPRAIIDFLLKTTLKELTTMGYFQISKDKSQLQSITGILTQMCCQHREDVCLSLLHFVRSSINEEISEKSVYVVPFISNIISMSDQLYHAFSPYLIDLVETEFMKKLAEQLPGNIRDWKQLNSVTLQNLYRLDNPSAALKILKFMLDGLSDASGTQIREQCSFLLEQSSNSLQRELHGSKFTWPKNGGPPQAVPFEIPLLDALRNHTKTVIQWLLESPPGQKRSILQRIATSLGFYHGCALAADILSHIILEGSSAEMVGLAVCMHEEMEPRLIKVFPETIQRIVSWFKIPHDKQKLRQGLENIYSLCKWERSLRKNKMSFPTRTQAFELLQNHLVTFSNFLTYDDEKITDTALLVLIQIGLPRRTANAVLMRLIRSTVAFIFENLGREESLSKSEVLLSVRQLVTSLCQIPTANRTMIRELLEGIFNADYACVLGGSPQNGEENIKIPEDDLMPQVNDLQAPFLSSKLHTGASFGESLGEKPNHSRLDEEFLAHNRMTYIQILYKAASVHEEGTGEGIPSETAHFMSLLLVELICPDVMYNGIQWPDEDYMKITVERDIVITQKFKNYPVLWDVMDLMSTAPGAMCYCSSILRALFAIQLSFWNACQERSPNREKSELICKILSLMTKGNLIPEMLSNSSDIVHLVAPFEVYRLLQNIWNYVKENPPVPERKRLKVCDPKYTEIIKSVIHAHIGLLAPHYAKFLILD